MNGDDSKAGKLLAQSSTVNRANLFVQMKFLVIDEVQRIPEIVTKLNLSVDSFPNLRVISSRSSGFDLIQKINEPLTGRSSVLRLFHFDQLELSDYENNLQTRECGGKIGFGVFNGA